MRALLILSLLFAGCQQSQERPKPLPKDMPSPVEIERPAAFDWPRPRTKDVAEEVVTALPPARDAVPQEIAHDHETMVESVKESPKKQVSVCNCDSQCSCQAKRGLGPCMCFPTRAVPAEEPVAEPEPEPTSQEERNQSNYSRIRRSMWQHDWTGERRRGRC